MNETLRTAVLLAATVTTGVLAGLFAAFAMAVMPGLRRVDDRTFIVVMRRINEAILNGWFALCFAGAPLLTLLAALLHLSGDGRPALPWIAAAGLLHAMALAITFAVNIPLNTALATAGDLDHIPAPATVRASFAPRWTRWNTARALTSTAALALLGYALHAGA
ncbi:anthrone oxygenase family protein [Streptomyces zagrosensis]|uniref:Putative membrane protein n=1 Tax=Streptomyces zagrosensis TaxID=1042984 RepID=A0A7W9QE43_9ACTN|nr:anthrone oxygenase family protein [Streptomyces zagrosensis]MBB5938259.1 putative membrane protein [Streptomyces zagrosensis]